MREKRIKEKEVYFGGYYSPLSDPDIQKIHNASMDVFESIGVKIAYAPVLELWRKAGAEIDKQTMIARMDRSTVMKCLETAPHEIVLCGRDPKYDIRLSGTQTHLGTGGTALNIIDPYTNERRPTTIHDVASAARVVDACENIDFFVIACFPTELDKSIVDVNRFYAAIQNTSKHVMGGVYTKDGVRKIARIAELIAGSKEAFKSRPFLSMITSVMSPLLFDESYTELMETACNMGFPLATSTAPMAGTTAPVTIAGTLVQMNVEALSGIITTQLMDPGHPTLYSVVPTCTDLRTGTFCFGSVEMGMMNAAAAQIARYYRLPIYNTAGPTESKILDSQSAYESTFSVVLTALAGANYIHEAAGILESGLTISLNNYVINNEIIGMVKRVLKGIEVSEEKLALDCIRRVGPGGTYISDEHTTRFMRQEAFYPDLADRKPRIVWETEGAVSAEERANRVAVHYLENHQPQTVNSETDHAIRSELPEILALTGTPIRRPYYTVGDFK
ncbi:MAG: trimethylamine methyltransferase family protein [Cloacibacillus porcorum]|uniref:trimethylamine methyltransferase family protein n=1 Tax=Cloacibacillus porcorum TaxID=1197717 RepID=UPI00235527B2|nr:trimethylamine methyltransferase family protein [Cloacibacillus porcorum]MCI5865420.1 trimethylamine methyltransferase family protein [Cloacibacillus porcorum]